MEAFWEWWSRIPGHMDPYIFQAGSFRVGYYGLMYLLGFATFYCLAVFRSKMDGFGYSSVLIQNYLYWAAMGLIIGARLGYVVFYNPGYYALNPLEIILPFDVRDGFRYTGIAGMSYHGGVLGVLAASVMFLAKNGVGFWRFADFVAPVLPLGYTFGRIGNFINGELYGRVTTVPWGMHFPLAPDGRLRHPSQLYEAVGEGVFLFALLWLLRKQRLFDGFLLAVYLIGYGAVRFVIEFFREPDVQLGAVLGPFSMGQALSAVMVAVGVSVVVARHGRGPRRAGSG